MKIDLQTPTTRGNCLSSDLCVAFNSINYMAQLESKCLSSRFMTNATYKSNILVE